MNLLVQLYRYQANSEKSRQRQEEIDKCFQINTAASFIQSVHVFLEKKEDEEYFRGKAADLSKVVFIHHDRQPTYKDFLVYAQGTFKENEVVCIAHSDIYLNWDFNLGFLDRFLGPSTVFGLTRHEPTNWEHSVCNEQTCALVHSTGGSADTFLFRLPLPSTLDLDAVNHKQNLYGGECVFLHEWNRAGANVLNPCFQIRTIHLHSGGVYFEQYGKLTTSRPYYPELEPCPTDTNSMMNRPIMLFEPGHVRCFRCRGFPNSFCRWKKGGKEWYCSICEMENQL
jgi:hypothetical protein